MLTKQQKIKQVEEGQNFIKESQVVVFTDFSGASVEDVKKLRKALREVGAKFRVIKKKLMRIVFEKSGLDFNPEQFDSQLGTIFANKDISEIASPVYKFSKALEIEKKEFKILGAFDLLTKSFIDGDTVKKIGSLPPREVLLGQFVFMLTMPIKKLMFVLNEKGRVSK